MVRDEFRLVKNSKWKSHIGAVVTLLIIAFYYNRLNVLQLKDMSVDKDPNSKGNVIAQIFLYGEYSLNFIHPASFPNRLTSSLLCVCGAIFVARQLLCIYVLMPRSISMEEIVTVLGIFLGSIFWSFTYNIEARNDMEPTYQQTFLMFSGLFIFIGGMFLSVGSEWQRRSLKVPGRLVTEGLWSFSMHINYFGEFLYYFGWSIITLEWYNFWVPIIMLIGFVWWHIPGLDEYLAGRYQEQFPNYAKTTKKLIPYIY